MLLRMRPRAIMSLHLPLRPNQLNLPLQLSLPLLFNQLHRFNCELILFLNFYQLYWQSDRLPSSLLEIKQTQLLF